MLPFNYQISQICTITHICTKVGSVTQKALYSEMEGKFVNITSLKAAASELFTFGIYTFLKNATISCLTIIIGN